MTCLERKARKARRATSLLACFAAFAFLFAAASCAGRTSQAPAAWTPRVERIESPAGKASAQPQLTASSGGAVLSWLENAGSETRVMFAERSLSRRSGAAAQADGWSEPRVVASGGDLFENWADLPSVARLGDGHGTLVAHWLRRSSQTASGYDVELATSADDGRTFRPRVARRPGNHARRQSGRRRGGRDDAAQRTL